MILFMISRLREDNNMKPNIIVKCRDYFHKWYILIIIYLESNVRNRAFINFLRSFGEK